MQALMISSLGKLWIEMDKTSSGESGQGAILMLAGLQKRWNLF